MATSNATPDGPDGLQRAGECKERRSKRRRVLSTVRRLVNFFAHPQGRQTTKDAIAKDYKAASADQSVQPSTTLASSSSRPLRNGYDRELRYQARNARRLAADTLASEYGRVSTNRCASTGQVGHVTEREQWRSLAVAIGKRMRRRQREEIVDAEIEESRSCLEGLAWEVILTTEALPFDAYAYTSSKAPARRLREPEQASDEPVSQAAQPATLPLQKGDASMASNAPCIALNGPTMPINIRDMCRAYKRAGQSFLDTVYYRSKVEDVKKYFPPSKQRRDWRLDEKKYTYFVVEDYEAYPKIARLVAERAVDGCVKMSLVCLFEEIAGRRIVDRWFRSLPINDTRKAANSRHEAFTNILLRTMGILRARLPHLDPGTLCLSFTHARIRCCAGGKHAEEWLAFANEIWCL